MDSLITHFLRHNKPAKWLSILRYID